ncbi:MAG: flagellin, partial [Rhodospirillaceae bacterium]|nr:flagellin [Rhodospirillaceae bacterium]
MTISVNTNNAAATALRMMQQTNGVLERTQLHITTGLRVNGPQDDAASYSIAQSMRGDVAGWHSVKTDLARSGAILETTIEAGRSIMDLLIEMKGKATQARDPGMGTSSRTKIQQALEALRGQIDTITTSAEFDGVSL